MTSFIASHRLLHRHLGIRFFAAIYCNIFIEVTVCLRLMLISGHFGPIISLLYDCLHSYYAGVSCKHIVVSYRIKYVLKTMSHEILL